MSDIPISSEHASDKKERPSQEASDLFPGLALPRHPVPSEHDLPLRPTPERDSLSADAERELLLPKIIKKVPDIIYEFARDAVLALSERERFTPNEIGSLRKADVIPGGIEIRGRRISEETTTTLAVYIGAVRTYLPSGQWGRGKEGLFEVFGQQVPQERSENDFAKIENSEKIIREYLDERDSREDESNLTDEEREALRRAPTRIIRLSGIQENPFPPLPEKSNERSDSNFPQDKRLRVKALQENADSVSERFESLTQAAQPHTSSARDNYEKNGPPENIVAHSNYSRALIRDLLESQSTKDALLSSELQKNLEQSVEALESFYPSISSTSLLSQIEKTGLRFNCELIVIQLRKLLRGAHLQSGHRAAPSSALLRVTKHGLPETSFSEKLEVVIEDLKALRKKSSSIFQ